MMFNGRKTKTTFSWKRKKIKISLLTVLVLGIIFLYYQMLSVKELADFAAAGYMSRVERVMRAMGINQTKWNDRLYGIQVPPLQDTTTQRNSLDFAIPGKLNISSSYVIMGVKKSDLKLYMPNSSNKFICLQTKEEVDFDKVNDDFCDCDEDGSDEPGTNACRNGHFYCNFTDLNNNQYMIPSSRVNDGICDCCDGSDEWLGKNLSFRLKDDIQKKLGRYQTPCLNSCKP